MTWFYCLSLQTHVHQDLLATVANADPGFDNESKAKLFETSPSWGTKNESTWGNLDPVFGKTYNMLETNIWKGTELQILPNSFELEQHQQHVDVFKWTPSPKSSESVGQIVQARETIPENWRSRSFSSWGYLTFNPPLSAPEQRGIAHLVPCSCV